MHSTYRVHHRSARFTLAICVVILAASGLFRCAKNEERPPASAQKTQEAVATPFVLIHSPIPLSLGSLTDGHWRKTREILPEDDGEGNFSFDLLGVDGDYALISVQNDTGWIPQVDLWVDPICAALILTSSDSAETRIALPESDFELRLDISGTQLQIDNGCRLLTADCVTGLYTGIQNQSLIGRLASELGGLPEGPGKAWVYLQDTVWTADAYSDVLRIIPVDNPSQTDSIVAVDRPEGAVISGMLKHEDRIFAWGLDYEFTHCPLLMWRLPEEQTDRPIPASVLTERGGLAARMSDSRLVFLEDEGDAFEYDMETGEKTVRADVTIDPQEYDQLLYCPVLDRFIGIVCDSY